MATKDEEKKPRSIAYELRKPMTEGEFRERILSFLPSMRDLRDEFITVGIDFANASEVKFIQTLCCDEEKGEYILEVGHYEHPGPNYKHKYDWTPYKIYTLEPEGEIGLSEVVGVFRKIILNQGKIDLAGWQDITMRIGGVEYY